MTSFHHAARHGFPRHRVALLLRVSVCANPGYPALSTKCSIPGESNSYSRTTSRSRTTIPLLPDAVCLLDLASSSGFVRAEATNRGASSVCCIPTPGWTPGARNPAGLNSVPLKNRTRSESATIPALPADGESITECFKIS
ncbi:hypothetical protein V8F06_004187 [Rhypophila decipiens]